MAKILQALAFFGGSFLHILLFSRGEWDRYAPVVVLAFILLCTTFFIALVLLTDCSITCSIVETCSTSFTLLCGLFISPIGYRLLFHPLQSFTGPFTARVSTIWVFRESWPDLRLYVKLRKIHDRYGDFVRIRPRELSICHPDAIIDVHGPRTRFQKGKFYEQIHPAHSLQFTRDASQHRYQRRNWDKAFQTKALREYTPRVVKHYKILMDRFTASSVLAEPVDASRLFMDLFFDVISDLTSGKSFDALKTGQRNPIAGEFIAQQQNVGFMLLIMWLFHLLRRIPLFTSRIVYWVQCYASSAAKKSEALKRPASRKRRWYANALENRKQSDTFEADGIHEAQLATIAGADTNAITVSNVCYFLCRHPEYQQKFHDELPDLPVHESVINDCHLMNKTCLLNMINETLRLYPPVPGSLQRLTLPEGATIAGRYVPGNIVVSTPTYALHRDSRTFVRPDEFVPERWSQPGLILRKDVFVPFSYGPYNCAGKPLAIMQLRMVIAMLIRKFEISFAPGTEAECARYIQDQADCFTLHIHSLPLMLKERIDSNLATQI
ncbi:benzoate 4-monooxygenase [Lizonia empirigonia]|nr:benzoate 4-monooxygenase [Lizonia empirigonia]